MSAFAPATNLPLSADKRDGWTVTDNRRMKQTGAGRPGVLEAIEKYLEARIASQRIKIAVEANPLLCP